MSGQELGQFPFVYGTRHADMKTVGYIARIVTF